MTTRPDPLDKWFKPHELAEFEAGRHNTPNGQNGAEAVKRAEPEPTVTCDPQFTEDRLALDFAETHANELRYVAKWGRWLQWLGSRWVSDDTLNVYTLARKICREAAARCNKPSTSANLSKAKTVAAVEQLARSDDRLKATIDQWDVVPSALNMSGDLANLDRRK